MMIMFFSSAFYLAKQSFYEKIRLYGNCHSDAPASGIPKHSRFIGGIHMYITIRRTLTAISALTLLLCTGCAGDGQNSSQAEESSAMCTTVETTTASPNTLAVAHTTTARTLVEPPRLVADAVSDTELAWHFENTLPLWTFTSAAFTLEKMVDPLTPEPIPELETVVIHTVLYEIEPESEMQGVAGWEAQYGALSPGDYRFTKTFYLDDRCEAELTCHIDFTIPEP